MLNDTPYIPIAEAGGFTALFGKAVPANCLPTLPSFARNSSIIAVFQLFIRIASKDKLRCYYNSQSLEIFGTGSIGFWRLDAL
jgi:hypothetical protein